MINNMEKFDIFIPGKIVNLVSIDNSFIENNNWYTWLNDQKVTKFTKQGYYPLNKEEHYKYVVDNIFAKKRIQLGIVKLKSNKLIGMISLYNINHIDQCCSVSALMNMRDKNITSIEYLLEAQNLLIDHAFNKLNLRRVEAAANDKKLCAFNEKLFGFKCEGILKERDYIDGSFKDRYVLAILKDNWDTIKKNRENNGSSR